MIRNLLSFAILAAFATVSHAQTAAPPPAPQPPPAASNTGTPFSFVVFGDIPYRVPQDFPRLDRLIAAINLAAPAFAIHVGDIKSANEPCTDEYFRTILARFNKAPDHVTADVAGAAGDEYGRR